jgi:pyridoxine 5'-phosphate synthase PdxJ
MNNENEILNPEEEKKGLDIWKIANSIVAAIALGLAIYAGYGIKFSVGTEPTWKKVSS